MTERSLFIGVLALIGCGAAVGACTETEGGTGSTGATGTSGGSTLSTTVMTSPATSAGPTGSGDTSATSPSTTTTSPSTTRMTFSGSDSSAESGEGTVNFIAVPDGGSCLQTGGGSGEWAASCKCDVWAQDCARGDKCTPWANDGGVFWNATRCSELDPSPGQVGDACTLEGTTVSGQDSCDIDSMCFNADPETLEGTCMAFCSGTPLDPVCALGSSCIMANDGALSVCLDQCDPLVQACPAGQACYGMGEPGASDPIVCMQEGSGVRAPTDGFPAMCPLGSTGVTPVLIAACADDEPCCAEWCSLDTPETCEVGLECVQWADPNAPGLFPQGVCIEG